MGDYVEPYVEGVDPIDPPGVESVPPFVDDAGTDLPVPQAESPAPVMFDPVEAEKPEKPAAQQQKKKTGK